MIVNRDLDPYKQKFRISSGKMNIPRTFHEQYFFRPKKFDTVEVQAIGHDLRITIWSRKQSIQMFLPLKRWNSGTPRTRSISDMSVSLNRWIPILKGVPDNEEEAMNGDYVLEVTIKGFDGRRWVPPNHIFTAAKEDDDSLDFYSKQEQERGRELTYMEAEFLIYRYIKECYKTKTTVKSREILRKYGYDCESKHNLTRVGEKLEELLVQDDLASSRRDKRYKITKEMKEMLNCGED